jgi:hypothetical protein
MSELHEMVRLSRQLEGAVTGRKPSSKEIRRELIQAYCDAHPEIGLFGAIIGVVGDKYEKEFISQVKSLKPPVKRETLIRLFKGLSAECQDIQVSLFKQFNVPDAQPVPLGYWYEYQEKLFFKTEHCTVELHLWDGKLMVY